MREDVLMLYRGKCKDKWVEGSLIFDNIIIPITEENISFEYENNEDMCMFTEKTKIGFYIVNPKTVGMMTGYRYGNNKEKAYQGDIIKLNRYHGDSMKGVIRFGNYDEYHTGFYIEWLGKEKDTLQDMSSSIGYWFKEAKPERIGNVHDNPIEE